MTLSWARADWGVQWSMPYIERSYRRPDHALIEEGRVRGWGDGTLAVRWRGLRAQLVGGQLSVELLGGLKFATGDDAELAGTVGHHHHHHTLYPDSGVHDHDLALGSGSTDGLLGMALAWEAADWRLRAQIQHKLRRTGGYAYRYADETAWEIAPGYEWKPGWLSELTLSGERKGLDESAGAAQVDTGFSFVWLGARLQTAWHERWSAEAAAEKPVRIRTSETMVVPDYRLRLALGWHF